MERYIQFIPDDVVLSRLAGKAVDVDSYEGRKLIDSMKLSEIKGIFSGFFNMYIQVVFSNLISFITQSLVQVQDSDEMEIKRSDLPKEECETWDQELAKVLHRFFGKETQDKDGHFCKDRRYDMRTLLMHTFEKGMNPVFDFTSPSDIVTGAAKPIFPEPVPPEKWPPIKKYSCNHYEYQITVNCSMQKFIHKLLSGQEFSGYLTECYFHTLAYCMQNTRMRDLASDDSSREKLCQDITMYILQESNASCQYGRGETYIKQAVMFAFCGCVQDPQSL